MPDGSARANGGTESGEGSGVHVFVLGSVGALVGGALVGRTRKCAGGGTLGGGTFGGGVFGGGIPVFPYPAFGLKTSILC